jgi:diaminopimelate epimerase
VSHFARYHALGNDYLVVDPAVVGPDVAPPTARLLCDRHFGLGADGLLVGPLGPVEPGEPVRLAILNPDGTACGRSGNGLRIFALHLAVRHPVGSEFVLRTAAGDSPVRVLDLGTGLVRVGMGRPSFDAADIPLLGESGPVLARPLLVGARELTVSCVHNGNPHTVVPLPAVSAGFAREFGPRIAGHARFPDRTNVQFLHVVDRGTVDIEIWERGAGYTLASGASACAAVSAGYELGLVDRRVRVRMPGGAVEVEVDDDGSVSMTGAAEQIAEGEFAPAFRRRLADAAVPVRRAAGAAAGQL